MNIANLRIGTRLGLGFGLVLTLLAGVALLGNFGMSRTNAALHHVVDVNVYKMGLLEDMSQAVHVVSRVMRNVVLIEDESSMQKELAVINEARKSYSAAEDILATLPLDEKGQALLAKMKEEQATTRPLNDKVVALGLANKNAEATQFLMGKAAPATAKWQDTLLEFVAVQKAKNKKDVEDANAAYRSARVLTLVLSGLAILVGAAIAWYLTRSITVPMRAAV